MNEAWQTVLSERSPVLLCSTYFYTVHCAFLFRILTLACFCFPFWYNSVSTPKGERLREGAVSRRPLTTSFGPGSSLRSHSWGAAQRPRAVVVTPLTSHFRSSTDVCLHPAYTERFPVKCSKCLFSETQIHMKTMATRKRCKLSRTGPDFENVIKRLLCVRTFHTRIGGDLTPGIINIGKPANAEQMGLQGSQC